MERRLEPEERQEFREWDRGIRPLLHIVARIKHDCYRLGKAPTPMDFV